MEFQCGRTSLTIDERNGAIVKLVDLQQGLVHLDARADGRRDGRLFRILAPTPLWASRHSDAHESEPPEVARDGARTCLRWAQLKARGEPLGVAVEVGIEPAAQGDEIRFIIKVSNHGPGPVADILFPWLGGWTGLGGKKKDLLILGAKTSFDPHAFPMNVGTTYARMHQRADFGYPLSLYAPWLDLSGPGGGISYIVYMATPQSGAVSVENLAGYGPGLRLAYGWDFPTVIEPGEHWTSPPIGLSVHGGDWKETADRFRIWMDGWFTAPARRREPRESIGFQNVWLRGFDGTPLRGLETVPAIAATGRRFGVDQLCIWDFITLGNYSKHADLDLLDYTRPERALLARGLAQARAEGTNVSALINFRLANPNSSLFKREAHQELIRCFDGSPRMEQYPTNHFHPLGRPCGFGPNSFILSAFAPTYRARVLRQTKEYADLGYVSMFYDQPFEIWPDYGRRGEGCRPEDTYGAVCSLVREVGALLRERNPEALLIGEFCEAFMAQHIDLWMAWYTDLISAKRAAYALPQTMHSWVVDSDRSQASNAFALGMQLCLCTHGNEGTLEDEPAFAEHVAALAKLRKRCAQRTVHSRFNYSRGLEIRGDDTIAAYSFDGAQGPAVILAAVRGAGRVTVAVDRQAFSSPGCRDLGRVCRLDGQVAPLACDSHHFTLSKDEVLVWEL